MHVDLAPSGYYVAAVSCRGQPRCRISLNAHFETKQDAERSLAAKARLWIADYLSSDSESREPR
jgi:hypothetical protein